MIKLKDWMNLLKYIAMKRKTVYDNSFPGNCGLLLEGGVLSFDCIGLVKSVINDPSIAKKKSPVGSWVTPGTVIPDATELGILQLCSDVRWYFNGVAYGEYLYMQGHAGVFVDTFDDGGECNTIECTTDWGANGVTTSYTDPFTGRRYDHKGGIEMRSWEAHGKLTPYIDYNEPKKEEPKKEEPKETSMFKDMKVDDKYYPYAKKLAKLKIMKANKHGNWKPDRVVTRKELAVIIYRALKEAKK